MTIQTVIFWDTHGASYREDGTGDWVEIDDYKKLLDEAKFLADFYNQHHEKEDHVCLEQYLTSKVTV